MNVASIELCKELYELSKWDDTYWMYGAKGMKPRTVLFGSRPTPAYDLGYLLRELPEGIPGNRYIEMDRGFVKGDPSWRFAYSRGGVFVEQDEVVEGIAPTPEDAACKLAIELFKQDILTKQPHLNESNMETKEQ